MTKKKLIVLAISSALLMGCNGGSDSSDPIPPPPVVDPGKPDITPPVDPDKPDILPPVVDPDTSVPPPVVDPGKPDITPPVDPDKPDILPPVVDPDKPAPPSVLDPAIQAHIATISTSGLTITGDVTCNQQQLSSNSTFTVKDGDSFSCYYGSVELLSVQAPQPRAVAGEVAQKILNFDTNAAFSDQLVAENSALLLKKISTCQSTVGQVCLDELNSFDISDLYGSDNNDAIDAFLHPTVSDEADKETEQVDKAPSSHVDPSVKPEISATETNLNAGFISAAAEEHYVYKPSAEVREITTAVLSDDSGQPIAGVNYYTASSRGITDAQGTFEYVWGEVITFGLDTFTFGDVKGNQLNYKLTDVADNKIIKQNITALIERYAQKNGDSVLFGENVHQTFALYPNAINEIINIKLPNGAIIEGTNFTVPNEFEQQFNAGLALDIDNQLRLSAFVYQTEIVNTVKTSTGNINATLKQLYTDVNQFHIFHDIGSYYGASGYARLMRNLNISNIAFPILMPRNDSNFWQSFGEDQAWTRELKPHVVDAKTIDKDSSVVMQRPPVVGDSNATFNLPGITAGEIGQGRVVFIGNAFYSSVLSCPDSYWASKSLTINNQQCVYQENGKPTDPTLSAQYDNGDMAQFFKNVFTWLASDYQNGSQSLTVATNITQAPYFDHGHQSAIPKYDFFIDPRFNIDLEIIASGGYDGLSPLSTPVLLLQSYALKTDVGAVTSDIEQPTLTLEDINALIEYVNAGGHIIFMDSIAEINPEPLAKLADMAGVSLGGSNVAHDTTQQNNCGVSYYCQGNIVPNVHTVTEKELVVYERFESLSEPESKIKINSDGTITWPKPNKMPKLEVASFPVSSDSTTKRYAFIQVESAQQKQMAIDEIKAAFPGVQQCQDSYEFEVNCIETRKGHGIPSFGHYSRTNYERYPMNVEVVDSMVQAANLGTNLDKLFAHELYYRTNGQQGKRLSLTELNQTYDNTSVWMWNDAQYRFDSGVDELGFETAVEYLNCYTNDQHKGGGVCTTTTRDQLIQHNFIAEDGELQPSYPLNYQEKPLTRIMLGRSFWDLEIKVDTTMYPGRPLMMNDSATVAISTANGGVIGTANNMQSTGLWAPQHQEVTINGGVAASITIALVDDLTGREQHELGLKRPPRVQKSFAYNGSSLTFKVPYGGLIYIKPTVLNSDPSSMVNFDFTGVAKASFWKNGQWLNQINTDVPFAEIDTGHVIYTTPVNNIANYSITDMERFSDEMNLFANAASDFHGRDQQQVEGTHRRFTYDVLPEYRHRFVNDVQISIGAAHSGYPVQSTTFNSAATTIPTKPVDDWLLWHEIGHNLAAVPFSFNGSTEVTNNILALYMQEQRPAPDNSMSRVKSDIQKMPILFARDKGHVWSHGDAGVRLVMFAQLKLWAENHFNIDPWYENTEQPSIYNADQGWNMFKLMHRKARGEKSDNEKMNYCSASETGLNQGDLLMVCSSYVSGYDLSSFFTLWEPSEVMSVLPNGDKLYDGGISAKGLQMLSILNLQQPEIKPEDITNLEQ
ncbi:SslE/AcfD family lipoprotein zinc metalloprotease [Photobacterium phosphoreum]|uniref:SslE/AcfD family lipoprotein zinc metalloprotease n=1 Tax=Photobacterium phosphoreum TaxID=659 RepID=UPI001EFCBE52|nr:SslE/AcfD family lipoprotein zinc metalloprotease [Photobacterium phosphoreum]